MSSFGSWGLYILFDWSRIANIGHLSVKRLSDKKPAFVVNATAPASHTLLTISEDSNLYLGGLPADYQVRLLTFNILISLTE